MSAAQAIGYLNAQRAAHGLPAGIVERPEWSDGCAKHATYLQLNGEDLNNPHDETPGKPGYTLEGQAAAQSAVLGGTWYTPDVNPWEDAPIHLMQLLGPELAETGYGSGCMWTWPGYTRPAPPTPTTYTYPGPGTTIYPTYRGAEWPFTPGDFVGLPQGTTTGPHLYVFVFGGNTDRVHLTAATLTGPTGATEVRMVDNFTANESGNIGQYLPPGGIVIPVNPLTPLADYHATVDGSTTTWSPIDGTEQIVPLRWDWTFRTGAMPTITIGTDDEQEPATVITKAVSARSKLHVNVNPNKGTGYWTFRVQKKTAINTWVTLAKTYKTYGKGETRTLNLKKGTYRVVVKAKYGYLGATSPEVYLKR